MDEDGSDHPREFFEGVQVPLDWHEGMPHVEWRVTLDSIRSAIPESRFNEVLQKVALRWLGLLCEKLGGDYRVTESKHFLLVDPLDSRRSKTLLGMLEEARSAVCAALGEAAWDTGCGKSIVLTFESLEHYYSYISYFYPEEGTFPRSGGICVNRGYLHIAFPRADDFWDLGAGILHELTHVFLSHLRLPRWLNEGVAEVMTRGKYVKFDPHEKRDHARYWDAQTIQMFWSGEGFRCLQSTHLSYRLGEALVRKLLGDLKRFRRFLLAADVADGGQRAALEHLKLDLAQLACSFLGPGPWEPQPETWRNAQ